MPLICKEKTSFNWPNSNNYETIDGGLNVLNKGA
jgi:hypothetical protein